MHNSVSPDPVSTTSQTRNLLRTWGNNTLRMEDKIDEQHIKLSTPFAHTQLNLGHIVDRERHVRGAGFELRSAGCGVLRASKGLLLSTESHGAHSKTIDERQALIRQLESALAQDKALNRSAKSAGLSTNDNNTQSSLLEGVRTFKEPTMLAYTPAGLVLATPKSIQLAAEEAVLLSSEQQIEMSAQQGVRCLTAESMSFFAEHGRINFIAAKADILCQAHDKTVQITAGSGVTITSESGRVAVSAKEELLLSCGGAYIRLKDGNITLSCPGDIIVQCQTWQKQGPSSLSVDYNHSSFSTEFNDEYIICHSATGEPLKQTRVKVVRSDGSELYYTTNDEGKIPMQKNDSREKLSIYVLGAAASEEEPANTTHFKK